jgi:hypothetical protein
MSEPEENEVPVMGDPTGGARRAPNLGVKVAVLLAGVAPLFGMFILNHLLKNKSDFWRLVPFTIFVGPIIVIGLIAMIRPYYRKLRSRLSKIQRR